MYCCAAINYRLVKKKDKTGTQAVLLRRLDSDVIGWLIEGRNIQDAVSKVVGVVGSPVLEMLLAVALEGWKYLVNGVSARAARKRAANGAGVGGRGRGGAAGGGRRATGQAEGLNQGSKVGISPAGQQSNTQLLGVRPAQAAGRANSGRGVDGLPATAIDPTPQNNNNNSNTNPHPRQILLPVRPGQGTGMPYTG
ncbi:hypothetical protein BDZ91DRAFT_782849 [Kalaharituber pfeilii]|nr:hypothetical protein BDZ91DRAFT_782849 [Kalaharituber pfeilii]